MTDLHKQISVALLNAGLPVLQTAGEESSASVFCGREHNSVLLAGISPTN